MTKQPNVVFRATIDTNDMNGTVGVKDGATVARDALLLFDEITERRDREAKMIDYTTRKTRKANSVEIEITFFCQFRLSLIKLQKGEGWAGYGRWA